MSNGRYTSVKRRAPAAVVLVCLAGLAFAQSEEPPATSEAADEEQKGPAMDEIVVVAEKPGDRRGVETPYEELMRQRILEEYDRAVREQEELAWRQQPSVSQPSRINFGYRPQDQQRDELGSSFNRLPMDRVKPATVFRFEF